MTERLDDPERLMHIVAKKAESRAHVGPTVELAEFVRGWNAEAENIKRGTPSTAA